MLSWLVVLASKLAADWFGTFWKVPRASSGINSHDETVPAVACEIGFCRGGSRSARLLFNSSSSTDCDISAIKRIDLVEIRLAFCLCQLDLIAETSRYLPLRRLSGIGILSYRFGLPFKIC